MYGLFRGVVRVHINTLRQAYAQIQTGNGRAACTRCGRTYDLNNLGIVVEGPAGRSLYRYRATYNQFGNTLSVNN